MRGKLILLALGIALQNFALAQEQSGLRFDNYAASSGMLFNPAAPFTSPNRWEINIVSAGFFVENKYLYFNHQSVLSLKNAYLQSSIPDPEVRYTNTKNIAVHTLAFIQGPSAFVKLNNINFGVFTDARSALGGLSERLSSPFSLDTLLYQHIYTTPAFKVAMMNWSEVGFNLGTKLYETDNASLSGAVNLKFLGGFDGMYFHNNESFEFEKIPHEQLTNFNRFNATYGYTADVGSNNYSLPNSFTGKGVGADIGFIYTLGEKPPGNYSWKFGASIVDIGKIHFTKTAGTYALMSNRDLSAGIAQLKTIYSLDEFNSVASEIINGDEGTAQTGNEFTIGLPTAITLQAERSLSNKFFINAVVVRRLPLSQTSIYRPNIIALMPRYESKWFSATAPVTMVDYRDVHVGAAIRLGPLTIGSDDLLSWMVKQKLEGTDLYAGLRIFPFWTEKKSKSKPSKENVRSYHSQHKGSSVSCPKF